MPFNTLPQHSLWLDSTEDALGFKHSGWLRCIVLQGASCVMWNGLHRILRIDVSIQIVRVPLTEVAP